MFGGYGNTFDKLMEFFGMDPEWWEDWVEFKAFWFSLTDDQRRYYRSVNLDK